MRYHRWAVSQAAAKKRKAVKDQWHRSVERVIAHNLTKRKYLSDFPAVAEYLEERFPDVDLSEVALYLSPPRVIDRCIQDVGGCYTSSLNVILVKDKIDKSTKPKGKFEKLMQETCGVKADVEDVVVHEFLHAVSHKIDRSLSRYTHMEEEFVYTNHCRS